MGLATRHLSQARRIELYEQKMQAYEAHAELQRKVNDQLRETCRRLHCDLLTTRADLLTARTLLGRSLDALYRPGLLKRWKLRRQLRKERR